MKIQNHLVVRCGKPVVSAKNRKTKRETNKEDRRSFSIYLTNKAKTIRDQLIAIAIDMNDKIFKDITHEDKKSILKILENISNNLS